MTGRRSDSNSIEPHYQLLRIEHCYVRWPCAIGDLPAGWTNLVVYSGKLALNFADIAPTDLLRDAVLCPEHTQMLESQLKDLGHAVMTEPMGSA